MTVLFYIIVICFAIAVITWSISEIAHNWQMSAVTSLAYAIGVLALLIRLIASVVTGQLITLEGLLAVFSFVLGLFCLVLQFVLMGTMIGPLSAFLLIAVEMSPKVLGTLADWLPETSNYNQPWLIPAVVLAMIGLAVAVSGVVLSMMFFFRKRSINKGTNAVVVEVTFKMPRIFLCLLLLGMLLLSLALIFYAFWCRTIFGVFWVTQPLFVVVGIAWMAILGIKMLKLES